MNDNILHFTKLTVLTVIYVLICISNNTLLLILSFVFYFYLIVKNRELSLELLAIVAFNFFNFIDPEIHGRVKNLFKIADIFILLNVIYFFFKYGIFNEYNNKYINAFLLYVIFEIIRSGIIYNQTFINAFQTGRNFLYIFIIIIFLSESDQVSLKYREKFIFLSSIICASILIFRRFFPDINIPPYVLAGIKDYNYSSVNKIYLNGAITMYLSLFYLISSFLTEGLKKRNIVLSLFLLAGIFNFVFRIFWFALFIAVFYIIVIQNVKNFKKVIIISIGAIVVLYSTKYIVPEFYISVYDSIYSAYLDITNPYGMSISGRVQADMIRHDILKNNILIGSGFYHPDLTNISLRTIDTGYLDIMISLGIIGFIILLIYYFSLYKEAKFFNSNWGMALKMFIVFSIVSLPAAATMSDVVYGYLPLALVYSLKIKE